MHKNKRNLKGEMKKGHKIFFTIFYMLAVLTSIWSILVIIIFGPLSAEAFLEKMSVGVLSVVDYLAFYTYPILLVFSLVSIGLIFWRKIPKWNLVLPLFYIFITLLFIFVSLDKLGIFYYILSYLDLPMALFFLYIMWRKKSKK